MMSKNTAHVGLTRKPYNKKKHPDLCSRFSLSEMTVSLIKPLPFGLWGLKNRIQCFLVIWIDIKSKL